jgi:hypothetical protein
MKGNPNRIREREREEALWISECLATLLATQVAQVQFPVLPRPIFRVEELALFCNSVSGGMFSRTAIEIITWVKKIAVAKVCGDLRLD